MRPHQIGAPSKYREWRPGQYEAIGRASDSDKRFITMCIPTGGGKSLVYHMLRILWKMRTVVLTVNNGLQDQNMRDFEESGLVDIRGQSHYPCLGVKDNGPLHREFSDLDPTTCDHGPCHAGYECELKESGCSYFDAVRISRNSRATVTSYAWWFAAGRQSGSGILAPVADLLVCDEAHAASAQLSRALSIQINNEILGRYADYRCDDWDAEEWKDWAIEYKSRIEQEIEALFIKVQQRPKFFMHELRQHQDLLRKVKRMRHLSEEWIPEVGSDGLNLSPVVPKWEAEKWLFRGAKKVVFISATIKPEMMSELGVDRREQEFIEIDSEFPVYRRPIFSVSGVSLNSRSTTEDYKRWAAKVDGIISPRQHLNGIIHTVSYERSKRLVRMSRFRSLMLRHSTKNFASTIQQFRASQGHCVLSPNLTTGWDFPYDDARYNIISKVAFPDTRSKLMQARLRRDKFYDLRIAAVDAQQAAGRIVRAPDDWGETFFIDANIRWLIRRCRHLFAKWFIQAYKEVDQLPRKLEIEVGY